MQTESGAAVSGVSSVAHTVLLLRASWLGKGQGQHTSDKEMLTLVSSGATSGQPRKDKNNQN